jgi:probable phosphoglycerate mutase
MILVGQGRTAWDDEGRLRGRLDVPLSEKGRKEVAGLARRLRRFKPRGVITGPGGASAETAAIYADVFGCRVRTFDELACADLGLWEGQLVSELEKRYPRTFRRWRKAPECAAPPMGETMDEVLSRVGAVVARFRRSRRTEAVVMVLPHEVRMAVEALLRGVSLETLRSGNSREEEWTGIDF